MFCTKCGSQLPESSKYCTNCGNPTTATAVMPHQQGSEIENSKFKNKFRFKKPLLVFLFTFIGLTIIVAIAVAIGASNPTVVGEGTNSVTGTVVSSGTSVTGLVVTVINWLLALIGLVGVIGLILGIILGIVYLVKASDEQGDKKSYHQRVAVWWFVAPTLIIMSVILMYVIVNVISNLVTNT